MEKIQQQINLFHGLFSVCLAICIFCFALSIIFLFQFDIRNIFNVRTGRSVKKTVQEVHERNAQTISCSGYLGKSRKPGSVRKARIEEIVEPPGCPTEPLAGMQIQETDERFGMFRIQKCILLIHTDEGSDVVNKGKGVKRA